MFEIIVWLTMSLMSSATLLQYHHHDCEGDIFINLLNAATDTALGTHNDSHSNHRECRHHAGKCAMHLSPAQRTSDDRAPATLTIDLHDCLIAEVADECSPGDGCQAGAAWLRDCGQPPTEPDAGPQSRRGPPML